MHFKVISEPVPGVEIINSVQAMIIRLWQEVEVQKDDRLIRKSANGNKEEAE